MSLRAMRSNPLIAMSKRLLRFTRNDKNNYIISFPRRVFSIHLPVVFRLLRVFFPSATFPQGVFGAFIPIGLRPSPPPCGWSTGFIAFPRTTGRFHIHRLRHAFPITTWLWSGFETFPRVA